MAEGIKFNLKFDKSALKKLARLNGQLGPALQRGVEQVFVDISKRIQSKIRKGDVLNTRSGALRQSWAAKPGKSTDYEVKTSGSMVRGHLGSRLKYAAIHEWGDTVTPKRAKMLAIPLDAAKTPAGVARKQSPRDYPDLFQIKTKSGNILLARRKGKRKRLEFLYALKKQVTIPATHYVDLSVKAREPVAPRIIDHEIQKEIDKVEAGQ